MSAEFLTVTSWSVSGNKTDIFMSTETPKKENEQSHKIKQDNESHLQTQIYGPESIMCLYLEGFVRATA